MIGLTAFKISVIGTMFIVRCLVSLKLQILFVYHVGRGNNFYVYIHYLYLLFYLYYYYYYLFITYNNS